MHAVIYPDNRQGDADQIANYVLEICKQHQQEDRALAFAFIISDLDNPHINKILRDNDYVNALHNISGKYLTIFFLNDFYVNNRLMKLKDSNIMRMELGVYQVDAPPDIQPKQLARLLIDEEISKTPSILFFQIQENVVSDYFITNLSENKIEDGFNEIKQIVNIAVDSFSKVTDENKKNRKEIFTLLKNALDSSEFWKKTSRQYEKIIKIKDFFFFWA